MPTYKPNKNLPFSYEAATDRLVEDISDANRDFVHVCVEARRNEPQKPRSIYNYALAASRLDRSCLGRPFGQLGKADYVACLGAWREILAVRSLGGLSNFLKLTYRDIHNTDALPRDIRKALLVKVPKDEDASAGRVVSEEEFRLLLAEAQDLNGGSNGTPTKTVWTALLWVLMDGGSSPPITHIRAFSVTVRRGPAEDALADGNR